MRHVKRYKFLWKKPKRCAKCAAGPVRWPGLVGDGRRRVRGWFGDEGIKRKYKGGVYRPPPSIFQRLDDEGIPVERFVGVEPPQAKVQ